MRLLVLYDPNGPSQAVPVATRRRVGRARRLSSVSLPPTMHLDAPSPTEHFARPLTTPSSVK